MEKEIRTQNSCRNKIFAGVIFLCLILFCESAFSESYGKNLYRNLRKRLSNDRTKYSHLTDREFSNFRAVIPGKLYRSSSPVNTWGKRNLIADREAKIEGVKTFINLADTNQSMKNYEGFSESYYSRQKIIGLKLSTKFFTEEFQQGLLRGIKFMLENEPPYLIHCDLGKDRAGFVCALIESLIGMSREEIENDYMRSFYNYFGVVKGSKEYEYILENEIKNFLAKAFGVESINKVNLSECAERYFLKIGLSPAEIGELRRILRF